MTIQELEQVIRDEFLDIYKAEYQGKISIEKMLPYGYHIALGLQVPEKPLVICGILEDDDFLKFLREEIRTKKLHYNTYRTLTLIQPTDSKCYDKG